MNKIIRASLRALILGFTLSLAAGCTTMLRDPVPMARIDEASFGTKTPIRYWGDQLPAAYANAFRRDKHILSLSGGGLNGAYGAGYLTGWSARGNRPNFDLVTGISVGAMIAPLAFLGPRYDPRLHAILSQVNTDHIAGPGFLAVLFGAPALADNTPVKRAIAYIIDEETLAAIAAEHRKGRRLLVGTTNLDAERPVVWDIGAIANSNIPNKLELVRQIILASAALPGFFPPVLIEVTIDGKQYDELHVDGGITQQFVMLPGGGQGAKSQGTLYAIYNGTTQPSPQIVKATGLSVLGRAVPTLLKYRDRGDVRELENTARAYGITYHLAAIPGGFPETPTKSAQIQAWLNDLYALGLQHGSAGSWQSSR
ncbi:patatin-like phospholipase family protein [Paradevosia shaoguanensis]|uniref:patatin-like phospholipase family protein n=1 Tax=Paradevosia shaoguanensis TaxID=1335043 RepID=UPI001931AE27|nr:patatin-like phospholipase family protein [Paradevosia shaoguanensis]